MATIHESNKAKIARRVVEVFEYFGGGAQSASVMDIVRSYGRPQSSTSELLASLVSMGLLYKDMRTRRYSPTPRLAALGAAAQPRLLRDGRMFAFAERLAASTRHTVALFGRVSTNVQVFHWWPGVDASAAALGNGATDPLYASAAGHLLLSAMEPTQMRRLLWRLRAEAPADRFDPAELGDRIHAMRRTQHATGPAGFGIDGRMTALMISPAGEERPLALGVVHGRNVAIDADALTATLQRGVAACLDDIRMSSETPPAPPLRIAV